MSDRSIENNKESQSQPKCKGEVPCGCRPCRWMIPVVLGVALLVVGYQLYRSYFGVFEQGVYEPPPLAFQGDSNDLDHTVIVPTMDTPMPEGKNVIWCGSFQLAWNQLRDDVIKEPLKINNAQEVVDRLNQAPFSQKDLPDNSYYAGAGLVSDGIVDKIKKEMLERFPQAELPEFTVGPQDILAYAFLQAGVEFTIPYFDREFVFTDSSGEETKVNGFGMFDGYSEVNEKLARQIEVLYHPMQGYSIRGYALDLSGTSRSVQLILARFFDRGESLAEMLADMEEEIATWPGSDEERQFQETDILMVPNTHWRITHHFAELESRDKTLANSAWLSYWIAEAWQGIEFKLDKSGALVASDSGIRVAAMPRHFDFTKPFLIYIKELDSEHPFFVMWVDNAELLCKVEE